MVDGSSARHATAEVKSVKTLRAFLENSGAGLRPAMNGRLAREITRARRPKGRRDASPTTFSKHVLSRPITVRSDAIPVVV